MAESSVEVRMFTSTQGYTLGISDYIAVRLIAISTANLIKDWIVFKLIGSEAFRLSCVVAV